MIELEKIVKKGILKMVKARASEERIADQIFNQLQPTVFDIQKGKIKKTKIFVPFLVEFDVKKQKIEIAVYHCLQDGRIASHWLRDEILRKLEGR